MNPSASRPSGDVGCAYHEVTRISFIEQRLVDLRVLAGSIAYRGVGGTARKIAERLNLVAPVAAPSARTGMAATDASLGLQPGEWVEVKSAEEIRATLDARGMVRGLYYMDEMWRFCGQRLRVMKRVERLMVERTGKMRSLRDTVLLEGTACDGSAHGGCDASCQHMWREVWLRRVDGPDAE